MKWRDKLYQPIDNAPLIIFRIFLGALIFLESIGAIFTGWVKTTLIDSKFTFSHIGFEWLQPLPGNGMYVYFTIMGILGLFIMIGLKYRWTLALFSLMWLCVYLMQKENYNNHYYLLFLTCVVMLFLPANQYASVDARLNPKIKSGIMPKWCSWIMISLISIVYFYAAIAKFYPDWLNGTFIRILYQHHVNWPYIGSYLKEEWVILGISYMGIAFDLFIIPLLLFKPTRTPAVLASLVFHLCNAVMLNIGIFPFFALSFIVFFYPPEQIQKIFFKNKTSDFENASFQTQLQILKYFFIPFLVIQLLLPLRHWFIKGNVLWTEEGHRLSWRMMLRSKTGMLQFKVVNKKTNEVVYYDVSKILTPMQQTFIVYKPDGIWQMAQRIKQEYTEKGENIALFIEAKVSVNEGPYENLIDPNYDFTQAQWSHFKHNDWILLPKKYN